MTSSEFSKTFETLIDDLEKWGTLSFEEKKTCLNKVEQIFKMNLGELLTSSDDLEKLFSCLSNPDIRNFRDHNSKKDDYPFWRALSSMRSMKYLPDYKPLYLLMIDILCQIQDVKEFSESGVSYVNSDKSLDYEEIRKKIKAIFEQTEDKRKIDSMLIVFRNHLASFLKLSGLDFYQVYKALDKNEFPEYLLSVKEKECQSFSSEEKQWVKLCVTFNLKYKEVCKKNPELKTLQQDIDKLFSYQSGEDLSSKQAAVYGFLSSSKAYPLLKCKEDMLPITEKIRHFILKCFGLAQGNKKDKAYTLSQNTIFASKTHQLAIKIAAHIPVEIKKRT